MARIGSVSLTTASQYVDLTGPGKLHFRISGADNVRIAFDQFSLDNGPYFTLDNGDVVVVKNPAGTQHGSSTGGRDYDEGQLYQGAEMDRVPTETARVEIMQRAIDVFPDLENAALVQQLAGSRPLSPDRMPIIGPVPGVEGIVLATGHSTKGIHLGPITGRIVTEYIQSGCSQISPEMETYLPSRFATASAIDFHASGRLVDE